MDNKLRPKKTNDLSAIRAILSTGSPLTPETFDYVYAEIKDDVLLGSISGGTDICSCFMGSNPTVPVVRGEIQTRHLGMAVEAWDDDGKVRATCWLSFVLVWHGKHTRGKVEGDA
jgi:acetoacetyl-CoA synthetase